MTTSLLRPARRLATLLVVATALSGCATVSDWWNGSDNAPKPTPLTAIDAPVPVKVQWEAGLAEAGSYAFTPSLMGDMVWAASRDGALQAVDLNTGRVASRLDTKLALAAGVGAKKGRVFVGTSAGELVALDDNGKELWRARLTSQALEAPQVDDDRVFVRTNDGRLSAFAVATGKPVWTFQRPLPPLTVRNYASMTLVANEVMLLGLPGGRLTAIRTAGGEQLWESVVSSPRGATELERIADIASRPVFDRGQVCADAFQGKLSCLDARSGTPMWSKDIASSRGLTVDGQNVYVTSDDGTVWALDRASGREVWKQSGLKHRGVSGPALLGRYVVVLDNEGIAHLLSNESGDFVGRQSLGGGKVVTQPQTVGERVLVQTQSSRVLALSL